MVVGVLLPAPQQQRANPQGLGQPLGQQAPGCLALPPWERVEVKEPATGWMKTQGLQHPFPTQLEHWKQPVAEGQCMQKTWPPHAFYPNHALFCFFLPSANWAAYSMTRTYMIKTEVKTNNYSRPY